MADLPLLLLHAFPVDARMWNSVRAPLAAHGRLITPDQRGLGRTPLPDTDRAPSLEDAARDVVALLDRLELDRVVLGGCSMGGYVTMAVLRLAPERVGGLVLVDTKATADAPEAAENRERVAARAEAEGVRGWLADSMLPNLLSERTRTTRPDVVETARDLIESQPPSGVAWAARAMAARPDSTDVLAAADVPALVVVGEEDGLTPPEAARAMADALPKAELAVLGGAGHLTPLEAPEALAEAVLGWWR
ncbi:pimeloyl-ACP methyl ester carboxylesterase [Amycolatopsis bartoniae]|uniref:Alpha/beta hydrolase n=1 Tax=Amycolatopsis bartoniae TaxID=941986 RepID=A0A8H9J355_9PSEU|nr:alpha/beta fold hydrolase [Amycolatopsis bartoniae]MBB2936188.1 pimeloyl-ACP methyl ester carboxylesterase [Amycolatopsis bartoniae]TVT07104.1 alpha/beta fold hydrolase [Amycolatopsis bartoniae]GHF80941.1 alpha/beta hydrolase [Amycolatopsis bartoniae]